MKVYIVHSYYHYDDYKRGESYSSVDGVFTTKDLAYECAIDNFKKMFDDYAKYNWSNNEICYDGQHKKKKENPFLCRDCGRTITKDKKLDLTDNNNLFTKDHILSILDDNTKTLVEKYDFIKENLFCNILPESEFSLMPTHYNYTVEEFDVQG